MKKLNRLFLVITAMAIILNIFSSCKKLEPQKIVSKDNLRGSVIKQYMWGEVGEDYQKLFDSFEKETGITVKNVMIPYATLDMKYILDISAGTQADVLYLTDERFPKYIIRGFAQNLEKYEDYFESGNEYWELVKNNTKFVWKNKIYGASEGCDPFLLIYNKTLFEENDIKTPLEYYNEGNWNWETFATVGKKLSTSSQTGLSQYGFGTWRFDLIVASGGGKLLDFTPDGKIEVMIDSEKTINSLNFLKNAQYTDKWMGLYGGSWLDDFKAGRCAMIAEGIWLLSSVLKDLKFEVDFVPFPLGPDNEEKLIPANTSSLGITVGAKNPYGVLAYLEYRYKYNLKNKQKSYEKSSLTKEQIKRFEAIKQMPFVTAFTNGVGDLANKQYGIWDAILFRGEEVATVVNSQKSVWQNEAKIAMDGNAGIPKILPFKAPPVIGFENNTYSEYITFKDKDDKFIGISNAEIITKEQGAIRGNKSVKFSFDEDPTGLFMLFKTTDKVKVPDYHTFKIAFDYKMLKDMPEGGMIITAITYKDKPVEGPYAREDKLTGLKAGDEGRFECELDLFNSDPGYCFSVIGLNAGDIILDNISIEALGD